MEKPDWVLWDDPRRSVTLEECVCLSLDMEPHQRPKPFPPVELSENPSPQGEPRAAPVVVWSGDHLSKQERNERLALTHEALLTPEGQERLEKLRLHFDKGSGRLPPAGPHSYHGYEEKRVKLLDFARWAYAMNWSVPGPLDLTPPPKSALAAPVPVVAGGKKWTPEKLTELKTYREAHTMPETAVKFNISEQRIRELLPSEKPKAKPFPGMIHRMK